MSFMATMMLAAFHTEVSTAVRLHARGDLTAEAAMREIMAALVRTEEAAQEELSKRTAK